MSNALFQLAAAAYISITATAAASHCSCQCQSAGPSICVWAECQSLLISIVMSGRGVPHVRAFGVVFSRALVVIGPPAPTNDVSSIISNFSARLQRLRSALHELTAPSAH